MRTLTAIIVAAGSSRRTGLDKLTALIAGKSVIEHTLDAFERSDPVVDIVLVTRQDRLREFEKLAGKMTKVRNVTAGGEHRQDSVRAGLCTLDPETTYVAVHDAARPLITPQQIERVFVASQQHGAAALAEPVRDTLKRAETAPFGSSFPPSKASAWPTGELLRVTASVDRDQLFVIQTPQIFERDLLEEAYRAVEAEKLRVTDEVSAVEHLRREVLLVPNDDFNFKITYQRDLRLAELVLQARAPRRRKA